MLKNKVPNGEEGKEELLEKLFQLLSILHIFSQLNTIENLPIK